MIDDWDSWDGLSGFGAIATICGWGVVAYCAYAFGFQGGLHAASDCYAKGAHCAVQVKKGWFGITYRTATPLPETTAGSK